LPDTTRLRCEPDTREAETPGKKHNILATPAGGPRHQVEREIADTQDGLLDNGVTASAKRLDPRQEFDERKGLTR